MSEDFADFVTAHAGSLHALARTLMGADDHRTQDLVQSTLLQVWTRWRRVSSLEHPRAYAQKILVRTFLKEKSRAWSGEAPSGLVFDASRRINEAVPDLDVLAALRTLPKQQRAVIVLRFALDLSEGEVASRLGCSVGTVKSQSSKALVKLRSRVELSEQEVGPR